MLRPKIVNSEPKFTFLTKKSKRFNSSDHPPIPLWEWSEDRDIRVRRFSELSDKDAEDDSSTDPEDSDPTPDKGNPQKPPPANPKEKPPKQTPPGKSKEKGKAVDKGKQNRSRARRKLTAVAEDKKLKKLRKKKKVKASKLLVKPPALKRSSTGKDDSGNTHTFDF